MKEHTGYPCGYKTVEGHWNKLNRKHPESKASGPEDKMEDTTVPSGWERAGILCRTLALSATWELSLWNLSAGQRSKAWYCMARPPMNTATVFSMSKETSPKYLNYHVEGQITWL